MICSRWKSQPNLAVSTIVLRSKKIEELETTLAALNAAEQQQVTPAEQEASIAPPWRTPHPLPPPPTTVLQGNQAHVADSVAPAAPNADVAAEVPGTGVPGTIAETTGAEVHGAPHAAVPEAPYASVPEAPHAAVPEATHRVRLAAAPAYGRNSGWGSQSTNRKCRNCNKYEYTSKGWCNNCGYGGSKYHGQNASSHSRRNWDAQQAQGASGRPQAKWKAKSKPKSRPVGERSAWNDVRGSTIEEVPDEPEPMPQAEETAEAPLVPPPVPPSEVIVVDATQEATMEADEANEADAREPIPASSSTDRPDLQVPAIQAPSSTIICSICQQMLSTFVAFWLPCCHCFHVFCIKKWWESSRIFLCPICKTDCSAALGDPEQWVENVRGGILPSGEPFIAEGQAHPNDGVLSHSAASSAAAEVVQDAPTIIAADAVSQGSSTAAVQSTSAAAAAVPATDAASTAAGQSASAADPVHDAASTAAPEASTASATDAASTAAPTTMAADAASTAAPTTNAADAASTAAPGGSTAACEDAPSLSTGHGAESRNSPESVKSSGSKVPSKRIRKKAPEQ